MQLKRLDILLLRGCIIDFEGLAFWSFIALEVFEGAFGCCKYLFVFVFA